MIKVHVVCGGTSSEREVSLRSGAAVAKALKNAGYDVMVLDTDCSDAELANCDVVFPVLHGAGGEDGEFQGRLENLGCKFVGSGSEASELCMDKDAYRAHMIELGFRMPEGATLSYDEYLASPLANEPHVVKPLDGGSTIDTFIIRDVQKIDSERVRESFDRHPRMIVEELIVGDEITVAVLGTEAMPVIEIIPPADGDFDYENKYNGKTQEVCPTDNIPADIQAEARSLAERIHQAAGCRDMSRTDFIINKAGELYLLETNTIPGLTDQSLFPKAAAAGGYPMVKLVDLFVRRALAR